MNITIDFPNGYRPYVFISQPMSGRTDDEILTVRNEAIQRIHEKWPNAKIIDSLFSDTIVTGNIGLKYLARSLEILAEADVAWFCREWDTARGCRIENQCAIEYGIPLVIEDYTEPPKEGKPECD